MEDEFYGSEAKLRIPVSVGKSRRIATPLTLRLVPLSVDDVVPVLNVDIAITQGACPDKCSCECQINTSAFGMYALIIITVELLYIDALLFVCSFA